MPMRGLVAEQVTAFRAEVPEAPVFLVGKSGGTGVIVKALEQLPENAVEAAVLLSPALSPGYDLAPAPAGRPARGGGVLVAAGRFRAGSGNEPLRHDRPGPIGECGACRFPRTG